MTKAEAIQAFWESFGIPAFEENSVPKDAPIPRITYELVTDSFGHRVMMTASLWDLSETPKEVNRLAEQVSRKIGEGGIFVPCDGGTVWITRGHPFSTGTGDPGNDLLKRQILNIAVEYLTNN